jgi:ABC-type uncharacterized transport system involved in gliding motility auxiliary subunit
MGRTLRAITAVVLVGIIVFCAISISQNLAKTLRVDITEQNLYTLSDGTRAILGRLNQPLKLRLFYTRTAARKAPDQIRFYNNYYYFVEALLGEYARASNGMVNLEVIDPRPFSDEEEEALRHGLKRFPITAEENFFFGLVLQTEFGVVKNIPFFSPDRQNFVEYDISHLIDTAITREKKRIGILSSLSVMGEEVTGYMAQLMRMQGRSPRPAWTVVHQLQQQYSVSKVETEVEEIKDVDILLVIHPAELAEKTLFAIDQFVLKGGRAIICVDPRCLAERPADPMGRERVSPSSDLNRLLRTWGVEMPAETFAGDRSLAVYAQVQQNRRMEQLIGYLSLTRECVNTDNVITANLNEVRVLFSGVLRKTGPGEGEGSDVQNEIIPLLQTTDRGNTWEAKPWDWVRINPERMMSYFSDGSKPVVMGYLIKGRFKSSFPEGIELADESGEDNSAKEEGEEGDSEGKKEEEAPKRRTGLTEASTDCAVVVFADVDFISDMVAYRDAFFGIKVGVGNNSDLLLNSIDDLGGSGDLIGIRSRGNFERPFVVVEEIRRTAEKETAEEIAKLNAEIAGFEEELQKILSSAKEGQEGIIAASIVKKQRALEEEKRAAERQLRRVQLKRREKIDQLGGLLQNLNMWSAPAVILLIAIILSIRRSVLRRRYVSHASDA